MQMKSLHKQCVSLLEHALGCVNFARTKFGTPTPFKQTHSAFIYKSIHRHVYRDQNIKSVMSPFWAEEVWVCGLWDNTGDELQAAVTGTWLRICSPRTVSPMACVATS